MSLAGGAAHGLIGLICADWALAAMGTTTDVMGHASTSISARLFFWVQFRLFSNNVGSGDSACYWGHQTPLHYLIAACMLNIVLDIVLSLLGLGVLGVALGTILSQTLSLWLHLHYPVPHQGKRTKLFYGRCDSQSGI